MNNTMQYKGYVGSVEFSEADGLFFGKVLGIRALISSEGTNAAELVADFHDAVDDYLSLCEAENSEPEKAYKGSFNIRVSPELHKPHPRKELLEYQVKQLLEVLEQEGLI